MRELKFCFQKFSKQNDSFFHAASFQIVAKSGEHWSGPVVCSSKRKEGDTHHVVWSRRFVWCTLLYKVHTYLRGPHQVIGPRSFKFSELLAHQVIWRVGSNLRVGQFCKLADIWNVCRCTRRVDRKKQKPRDDLLQPAQHLPYWLTFAR